MYCRFLTKVNLNAFAGKHGARDACKDAVGGVIRPEDFPLVNALPDLFYFFSRYRAVTTFPVDR